MHKPHIAFLGLGTMGTGMAHRLLGAGYSVNVYNRTPERAATLSKEGAHVVKTPREAARGAGLLISMLADDTASRAIWLGDDGALAGADRGAIAIDCSTVTVAWIRELAAAAQAKGVEFLDAPVTGTKPHAANGELTFLVGGDASTLDKIRPILAAMSKEAIHLGPIGSGAALKLINNFVCGVQATALAEASALLLRAGLNPAIALPVLLNGAPGSPLVKTLSTRHASHDPTIYFQLRLMAKDIAYAVAEAESHGLDLATGRAALKTFTAAIPAHGNKDLSAILEFVEQSKAGPPE